MSRRAAVRAAVLLAGLAAAAWAVTRAGGAEGARWASVERRDLVIGVEVEGELRAVDSALLGPPQVASIWNFKISRMAPEGVVVAQGDPVLSFDVTELRRTYQQMVAERDAAEKELEKRQRDLEAERGDRELQLAEAEARLRKAVLKLDVPGEVVSRSELEEWRIDHRLAQLEIDNLKAELGHLAARAAADVAGLAGKRDRAAGRVAEIEEQLRQMDVRAPRAGTVIYKTDWRGGKKKVGDQIWRADTVLEIPDLSRMVAEGQVDEAQAGRLVVGQPVTLRLDAYPDRQYTGRLGGIRRTVQTKSWRNPVKVVRVTIELDATDEERMRPGMRFRGKVEVERVPDALVVPESAVQLRAEGAVVERRSAFGVEEVVPVLGRRDGESFEVVSGLAAGDRVRRGGGAAEERR